MTFDTTPSFLSWTIKIIKVNVRPTNSTFFAIKLFFVLIRLFFICLLKRTKSLKETWPSFILLADYGMKKHMKTAEQRRQWVTVLYPRMIYIDHRGEMTRSFLVRLKIKIIHIFCTLQQLRENSNMSYQPVKTVK